MDLNELFSKTLRTTRIKKGLSQEELADICGLHRTYISLVERNRRNITLQNFEKIAKGLNVEPYLLIKEESLDDSVKK